MADVPLREQAKDYVSEFVGEVLTDPEVEEKGLNFIDKLFRQGKTHEAGLLLLSNLLKDERFLARSKDFGTDLLQDVLKKEATQEDIKRLAVRVLEDPRVLKETVEVLRYVMAQKDAENVLVDYFTRVFQRDDLLRQVTSGLIKATQNMLRTEDVQKSFGKFIITVVDFEPVKQGVFESYVFKPFRSFLTFGLYEQESVKETPKVEIKEEVKTEIKA